MKKFLSLTLALIAILSLLIVPASAALALEDETATTNHVAFKVISEDADGNRTEYATSRYYDDGYSVDLTYNKVKDTCTLAVGYKNVLLVSELQLKHEIDQYGVDSLTHNQTGLVAPVRMAKAENQAINAGNLSDAIEAFVNNGLKVEIMIFDTDLLPTAYDISEAKG